MVSFHDPLHINPSEFYSKAVSISAQISDVSSSLLYWRLLKADLIEREKTYTADLWKRSLDVFYTHLLGAQLPPEMEADAIQPIKHPRPRVVLITDYVEEVIFGLSAVDFSYKS